MAAAHPLNGHVQTSAEAIALALKGKKTGTGQFMACCPAHDDRAPSLSITQNRERVLFHCHAGCSQAEVIDALRGRQLWPPVASESYISYLYKNKLGEPLFRVNRRPGKLFSQERYETGRWISKLLDTKRVLYHSDEIARRPTETIYLAEGERDVETLRSHGYLSSCNPMGAGKWDESYSRTISRRDVVLFYDNDQPGQKHARVVALSVLKASCKLRIVDLPAAFKDVTDYVSAGHPFSLLSGSYEKATKS